MSVKIFQDYQGSSVKIDGQCYIFVEETTEAINADPSEIGGIYDSCLQCELESSSSSTSSSSESSESFNNVSSSSSSSSGFYPYDINNLYAWYDASDSNTITESAGSISQIDDKWTGGWDLTQGTGTKQPQYLSSGFNGLGCMFFDGVDDDMENLSASPSGAFTIFMAVTAFSPFDTNDGIYSSHNVFNFAGALQLSFAGSANMDYRYHDATTTQRQITYGSPVNNTRYLFTAWNTGSQQKAFLNGSQTGSTRNDTFSLFSSRIRLGVNRGNNAYARFYCGEVVIYDRDLTDGERITVENYLMDKWGI